MFENLLRWVRVRSLSEGKMQTGRVEGLPNDARDAAQRPQDYGFAANPVTGEGLRLEVGGHTVIIRLDRLAERPELDAYEVALWHKEGHMIRLRAGKLIEVDCDRYVVNAPGGIEFNAPTVTASGLVSALAVAAADSLEVQGKEMGTHTHPTGGPNTGEPN